jgi:hypothetical protein
LRGYLFTELEVERLLAWLEHDEEDDEVRMLFSRIRKSYPTISVQLRVFFLVIRKLIALGRWDSRPRMEELMGPELAKRVRNLKAYKKRR